MGIASQNSAPGGERRSSAAFDGVPSPTQPFGVYQLHDKIGHGGFAEVFTAGLRGTSDHAGLVIKRLHSHLVADAESVEMFLDEARLMAELDHSSIVRIVALEKIEDSWSIVMERVDGGNLGDLFDLARKIERQMGLVPAVYIARQVALALAHAHDRADEDTGSTLGIIHRDIKPDNILISWDGEVKITDFGCAKAAIQTRHTRPGVRKGTLDYMSPEQCLGRVVDVRSDIFSLGVVLWELVTGQRLYADASDARVMERIAHEVPRPPSWENPRVNASLDLLVLRALEKQPADRFATAAELARALGWWLERYADEDPVAAVCTWLEENWRPRVGVEPSFRAQSAARKHADIAVRVSSSANEDADEPEPAVEEPGRDDFVDMARFAALQSIVARHTNLPPEADVFIGRAAQLAMLNEALVAANQLVCVHGGPGIGKSRLAVAFARRRLSAPETRTGGVWLCDLAQAQSADDLCAAVTRTLSLPSPADEDDTDAIDHVARSLAERGSTLLVLDNADDLDSGCERVLRHWCRSADELEIIVTARRPLQTLEAVCIAVPPLSLPLQPAIAAESESVQLLTARVRAVQPQFGLHVDNADAVCEMVRRLQGNPQAIEIAAARLRADDDNAAGDNVSAMAEIGATARPTLDKHTLESAVQWSWSRLSPSHQTVLAQATVFHGGFTIEAATAVLSPDAGDDTEVVDLLRDLRERSLLQAYEPGEMPGQRRFRVVRLAAGFARAQLIAQPDAADTLQRHADYYLAFAERSAAACYQDHGATHVRALRLEIDNLNAIMARSLRVKPPTRNSATRTLRAALAIAPYAHLRGRHDVWAEWLELALTAATGLPLDAELLIQAWHDHVHVCTMLGRLPAAEKSLAAASSLAEDSDQDRLRAQVALAAGELALARHQARGGRSHFKRAISLLNGSPRSLDIAAAYVGMGRAAALESRLETAEACLDAARRLYGDQGHRHGEAMATAALGGVRLRLDQLQEAAEDLRRALAGLRALGDRGRQTAVMLDLAGLARTKGDFDGARRHCEEALHSARQLGDEGLVERATRLLATIGG